MPEVGPSLPTPVPFLLLFTPDELTLRFENIWDKSICLSSCSLFIELAYARVTTHKVTLAVLSFLLETFFFKETGFLSLVVEEVIASLHPKSFPNNIDTPFICLLAHGDWPSY